jgi:phage gp36-like protein
MDYATPDDLLSRYPQRLLAQLTDEAGQAYQPEVARRALADAAAEINGYLVGRYALPLASTPVVLTRLSCDIALYRLMGLRPAGDIEDARRRYEDAVRVLERIGDGRINLGVAAPAEPPPATDGGPRGAKTDADRLFSPTTLRGF